LSFLGTTNQKLSLPTLYSPTINHFFLSITLTISASSFHLNVFTEASTKSPFIAVDLFLPKTKYHFLVFHVSFSVSTSTKPKSPFH